MTCSSGQWIGQNPLCKSSSANCQLPHEHEFDHSFHELVDDRGMSMIESQVVVQNSRVKYYCYSGYRMVNSQDEMIIRTCVNGQWQGDIPVCGEFM